MQTAAAVTMVRDDAFFLKAWLEVVLDFRPVFSLVKVDLGFI